jgi:hypothetical protein
MFRKAVLGSLAVVLVVGAGVAFGATRGEAAHINCLDTVWRTQPVSTRSTTFVAVPGLADTPNAIHPMAVTVSAEVTGAPVEFRLRNTNIGAQTTTSRPGPVVFVPRNGGPDAFSFQWVEPDGSAAVRSNELQLQWRSRSGDPVTIDRADLTVVYQTEAGACTGP